MICYILLTPLNYSSYATGAEVPNLCFHIIVHFGKTIILYLEQMVSILTVEWIVFLREFCIIYNVPKVGNLWRRVNKCSSFLLL